MPFSPPSLLRTLPPNLQQMAAPREEGGREGGKAGCVALAWEPVEGAEAYLIEMRGQGKVRWREVGRVGGTSVKKKNLEGGKGYHFRVRPLGEGGEVGTEDEWAWSAWSDALTPPFLSPSLKRLLGGKLLIGGREGGREGGVEELLAGKVVGVYASAHWCGPCRQFTPLLADFYSRMGGGREGGREGGRLEVVFVSLDQEKEAFNGYFGGMPWLALPWDDEEGGEGGREGVVSAYGITSIPRLLIFGRDGRLLENYAVGQQFLREEALNAWWEGKSFSGQGGHVHKGGGGCCGGGGGGGC